MKANLFFILLFGLTTLKSQNPQLIIVREDMSKEFIWRKYFNIRGSSVKSDSIIFFSDSIICRSLLLQERLPKFHKSTIIYFNFHDTITADTIINKRKKGDFLFRKETGHKAGYFIPCSRTEYLLILTSQSLYQSRVRIYQLLPDIKKALDII